MFYACIIYYAYLCYMQKKTRFIQLEFYIDYDTPSDYLVIVEVVDDIPKATYSVRVPEPYTLFPRTPHIKN